MCLQEFQGESLNYSLVFICVINHACSSELIKIMVKIDKNEENSFY